MYFSLADSNVSLKDEFRLLGITKSQSLSDFKPTEMVRDIRLMGSRTTSESCIPKEILDRRKDHWSLIEEHKQFLSQALEDKEKQKTGTLKGKEREVVKSTTEVMASSMKKGENKFLQLIFIAMVFLLFGLLVVRFK